MSFCPYLFYYLFQNLLAEKLMIRIGKRFLAHPSSKYLFWGFKLEKQFFFIFDEFNTAIFNAMLCLQLNSNTNFKFGIIYLFKVVILFAIFQIYPSFLFLVSKNVSFPLRVGRWSSILTWQNLRKSVFSMEISTNLQFINLLHILC